MGVKGIAGEGSEGNETPVIWKWRKGDRCYTVAESLAELCSTAMWKGEFGDSELDYLAQKVSKQSAEVTA